jgi:hypothetical protein
VQQGILISFDSVIRKKDTFLTSARFRGVGGLSDRLGSLSSIHHLLHIRLDQAFSELKSDTDQFLPLL